MNYPVVNPSSLRKKKTGHAARHYHSPDAYFKLIPSTSKCHALPSPDIGKQKCHPMVSASTHLLQSYSNTYICDIVFTGYVPPLFFTLNSSVILFRGGWGGGGEGVLWELESLNKHQKPLFRNLTDERGRERGRG